MRITASLLVLSLLIIGCQESNQQGSTDSEQQAAETPPVDEDDLLLRLSAYLNTDTSRATQDQNAIVDYAIENLLDVHATNTGLFYRIIKEGDGETITWGDFLSAHYKGYLLDGKVFADSRKQDRTLEFYVGNMIDAWNEGLQLIKVGGQIQLLVPSRMGYGAEGLTSSMGRTIVPPHQILVFEVEVLDKREK